MTIRYVHHTLNQQKNYAGLPLQPLEVRTIPYQVFDKWASSDVIAQAVMDGDIKISIDGINVPATKSGQIDLLKSALPATIQVVSGAVESAKSVIMFSNTEVDLPKVNEEWYTILNDTDGGLLDSFFIRFNSDRVVLDISIDGESWGTFDCQDLEDLFDGLDDLPVLGYIKWYPEANVFYFNPSSAISFSSIVIKARANSYSSGRDLEGYVFNIRRS